MFLQAISRCNVLTFMNFQHTGQIRSPHSAIGLVSLIMVDVSYLLFAYQVVDKKSALFTFINLVDYRSHDSSVTTGSSIRFLKFSVIFL
jgi:hypothetical protein